jgi:hypothetical protein
LPARASPARASPARSSCSIRVDRRARDALDAQEPQAGAGYPQPIEHCDGNGLRRIIGHARATVDRVALVGARRMYRQPPAVFAALLDRRAPSVRDT